MAVKFLRERIASGEAGLLLLTGLGFPAVVAFLFIMVVAQAYPLTLNAGDWYFSRSLVVIAALGGLAVWSYRVLEGGRSVLE